jgi:hypothetical protein
MNRIRFSFLAAMLVGSATAACKSKDCPPAPNPTPCPTGSEKMVPPIVPSTTPEPMGSAGAGGGPGACTEMACMVGQHECTKAECITSATSTLGIKICEFGPTLVGACRCHVGDRRPCGTTGLWKTCIAFSATETRWGTCSAP